MTDHADIRKRLASLHAEALQVGDSPLRADRLADKFAPFLEQLDTAALAGDTIARIHAAVGDADRVLRRDDDGREAARHLQGALRLLEDRVRKPSPFFDD